MFFPILLTYHNLAGNNRAGWEIILREEITGFIINTTDGYTQRKQMNHLPYGFGVPPKNGYGLVLGYTLICLGI